MEINICDTIEQIRNNPEFQKIIETLDKKVSDVAIQHLFWCCTMKSRNAMFTATIEGSPAFRILTNYDKEGNPSFRFLDLPPSQQLSVSDSGEKAKT